LEGSPLHALILPAGEWIGMGTAKRDGAKKRPGFGLPFQIPRGKEAMKNSYRGN
jgi:hypothetical protein